MEGAIATANSYNNNDNTNNTQQQQQKQQQQQQQKQQHQLRNAISDGQPPSQPLRTSPSANNKSPARPKERANFGARSNTF